MFHIHGTQKSIRCPECRRPRLAEMQGVAFSHALLSLLTCGLWLPVLLYKLTFPKFRCTRCGTEV